MWQWCKQERFNRTTMIMVGCASGLLGLVIARRVMIPIWPVLVLGIAAALTIRKRSIAALVILVLALGTMGIWRGSAYRTALQPYHTFAYKQVTFAVTAAGDAAYGKKSQISFVGQHARFEQPAKVAPPGSIKVSGFGALSVFRGDEVRVTGKLYPTRGASQATVSYAQLSIIDSHQTAIDTFRRKFTAGLQSALPEPLASFGLGLLIGQRNTLPPELTQALLMVGLTHIIAVSGYNLTILLEAAKRLLGSRSKVLTTVLALTLTAGFLLVAGASASIVRAAVISTLGLAAWYYGRTIRPVLLILLAAIGTALANPNYLWSDIGWYLSFLAFFGILVVGPIITSVLYKKRAPPLLAQILIESLCAEIMTIPLVLYIFGQFSLISLVANMVVVALIPLAMLMSFIAGLAGMLAGSISGWFAWPATLLLTYMLDAVQLMSRIPHVFQQNRYVSALDMTVWYGAICLALFIGFIRKKRKSWYSAQNIRSAVIKPTGIQ